MTNRNDNNPSGSETGREERKDQGLIGNPQQENTTSGGAFNETQRTGYSTGIGSAPTQLSTGTTSRTEEGDEEFGGEEREKNYDDYNREYKRENNNM